MIKKLWNNFKIIYTHVNYIIINIWKTGRIQQKRYLKIDVFGKSKRFFQILEQKALAWFLGNKNPRRNLLDFYVINSNKNII